VSPCSLPRPRNGNFAHASRSDGPRNLLELQALHPAQPSALVLYCSDFTLTLLHTGRSLDHRNPTGAQRATSARSGFLIVCCSDCTPASFPYASASFTHSHTLSLDSCCRPTAGKSSSPAGLSTLVYAYVVDCAPASPYAYSSSSHRFPDERTPIEATLLFQRHLWSLVWVWVWVWDWIHWHASPRTRSPSYLHPPFTHYSFSSRSLVRDGHTSPHMPRLVVPHSTCPSLSRCLPRTQLYNRSCSNKHTNTQRIGVSAIESGRNCGGLHPRSPTPLEVVWVTLRWTGSEYVSLGTATLSDLDSG